MRYRLLLAVSLCALGLATYAGGVLATPGSGFTGTTLAKATYGEVFSHVHTLPAAWDELIQTKGSSDLYVQENTWQPGGSTGWHTHPGPSFVIVIQGTVTVYSGDDPACTPHVYTAGTREDSFIDAGGGHVHIIRNESGSLAKTIAVQLVPAGAVRRQDAPAPGDCPF